jgi:deazaflavin-dependent oxidoreductase (nitroreductase family)
MKIGLPLEPFEMAFVQERLCVTKTNLTLFQTIEQQANNLLMTRLVPLDRPGRGLKWFFKIPLALQSLGLGFLLPPWLLILTTCGRKSGRLRRAAMECSYYPVDHSYRVMAGWAGRTDWFRNACADPRVKIYVRGKQMNALSTRLTEDETLQLMQDTLRINPAALQIFSRLARRPLEATPEGLRSAVPLFPSLKFIPVPE